MSVNALRYPIPALPAGSPALNYLNVSFNRILELDLSGYPGLRTSSATTTASRRSTSPRCRVTGTLRAGYNAATMLSPADCPGLKVLDICGLQTGDNLDLSASKALEEFRPFAHRNHEGGLICQRQAPPDRAFAQFPPGHRPFGQCPRGASRREPELVGIRRHIAPREAQVPRLQPQRPLFHRPERVQGNFDAPSVALSTTFRPSASRKATASDASTFRPTSSRTSLRKQARSFTSTAPTTASRPPTSRRLPALLGLDIRANLTWRRMRS